LRKIRKRELDPQAGLGTLFTKEDRKQSFENLSPEKNKKALENRT